MTSIALELQKTLESAYSKNQLYPRLNAEFKALLGDQLKGLEAIGLPRQFVLDLLSEMALRKRANFPTLGGLLRRHFNTVEELSQALDLAVRVDLVNFDPSDGPDGRFILQWDLSQQIWLELEAFQYPLPMVVPPRQLKHNRSSAYLEGTGSLILKNNHHNNDINLDHLNRVNKVRLVINERTAAMVKNTWRHIDSRKVGESQGEYQKRRKAFDKYDRSARTVIDLLKSAGDYFYLTHKYDKRGRDYVQGYHVSHQGNDWNKATVEFYNQEITE